MIFHEIYGNYYHAVGEILAESVEGKLTQDSLFQIVRKTAFSESSLTIPEALKEGRWPVLNKDLSTHIQRKPSMPLTTLERRWMKAILLDRRMQLFDLPMDGLEDVELLYTPDMIRYYDQHKDGDPYDDQAYIERFRKIRSAIHNKRRMEINYSPRFGTSKVYIGAPVKLEYSQKDDKFRLYFDTDDDVFYLNLARMNSVKILEKAKTQTLPEVNLRMRSVTIELTDTRNALERAMLEFSDLQKETVHISNDRYRITLHYERNDEVEILIRILAFGPMVEVKSPDRFRRKIKERIEQQMKLRT